MKSLLKPIFEIITGEYTLFNNVLYNYIAMTIVGIIAFKIAWDFVHRLYDWGIISGSNSGSFIHWSVRTIAFIVVFYIFSLIIWLTKFIYTYRFVILIVLGIVTLFIIIFKIIKNRKYNISKGE